MNVFIVYEWNFEGYTVKGIYSTRELANAAMSEYAAAHNAKEQALADEISHKNDDLTRYAAEIYAEITDEQGYLAFKYECDSFACASGMEVVSCLLDQPCRQWNEQLPVSKEQEQPR